MDKQKQIEEMTELMGNWALRNNMCWHEGHAKALAETFVENDYGKIPENEVVLTREEHMARDYECYNLGYEAHKQESQKREDYIKALEHHINDLERALIIARKETAEKFAERLKELVAERNCNEDYDWCDIQIDGQIFVECVDEIAKEFTEGKA